MSSLGEDPPAGFTTRCLACCLGLSSGGAKSGKPREGEGMGQGRRDGKDRGVPEQLRVQPAGPPPPIPPAERCVVEGPGLAEVGGFAGESTYFAVACFREGGDELDNFVVSNLIVEVTGPATLVPTISKSGTGAKVSYTARKAGSYSVAVSYFSDPVPGSPFIVGILPGKIDGERSSVEHPSGLAQGVMVTSLFMERRVKVISRDNCDNERSTGGLLRGFRIATELIADEVEEDAMGSRTQNEDRAWRLARERPDRAGPLRKRRFGGLLSGWEACHFCLAGDALFYAASPADAQPRGVLYLDGARARDLGGGGFEVFAPLAYSRANLVKEKQVNRVFTLRADNPRASAEWVAAIQSAKPLSEGELLQERDGHAAGRGFDAGEIEALRTKIAQAAAGSAVNQVAWENDTSLDPPAGAELEEVRVEVTGGDGEAGVAGGSAGGGCGTETGLTSKQAQVQATMRNPSLTPQERQARIQEIMRQPNLPPPGAGGAEWGCAGAESKQARVAALMRDTSLTAKERQSRIQAVMHEEALASAAPDSDRTLREQQQRVAAMLAQGKGRLGEKWDSAVEGGDAAGDRTVEVRVVVSASEGIGAGQDETIPLGVMPATATAREVKAAATFGVQQLGLGGADGARFAPDRTRLVVAASGQVLEDEDRALARVAPHDPALALLLVPRELQAAVLSDIAAHAEMAARHTAERGASSVEEERGVAAAEERLGWAGAAGVRVSGRLDSDLDAEVLTMEEVHETQGGDVDTDATDFMDPACTMIVQDNGDGSYWLNFSFVARGVFKVSVSYRGATLKGGVFQAVVLKPDAYTKLGARLAPPSTRPRGTAAAAATATAAAEDQERVTFPAMLLGEDERWTSVDVRFTARQMTLYESSGGMLEQLTGLRLFKRRLHGCPIRPNVQFAPVAGGPKVEISDGSGVELVLSTPDRMLVQATFYLLLQRRLEGAGGTFNQRRATLFRQIKRQCPSISGAHVVRVRRNRLAADAFSAIEKQEDKIWRQEWQVRFEGEAGVDWGGLQREFFTVLGRELFSTKAHHDGKPLWVRMGTDAGPLVHPNSEASSEKQLKWFAFAGRIVGKCLYDAAVKGSSHLLPVHLTRSFIKMLLGVPISFHDFETDDPQLYKSKVKYMAENSIDDAGLDLMFVEERYSKKGVLLSATPLVPGGDKLPVTDANKKRYLTLLARFRLGLAPAPHRPDSSSPQVAAFLEGFYAMVPEDLLEPFDAHELELLLCGMPDVPFADFKAHTVYPSLAQPLSNPIVQWFWQAVENLSMEDRARLLQFITGSSQVPSGGFRDLEPKLNIQLTHAPPTHLPVSHTCFNTLELPRYRCFAQAPPAHPHRRTSASRHRPGERLSGSGAQVQERLALAIKEGAEGFGEA